MKEIVSVIGYENKYMISDDGIVFRVTEKGLRTLHPIRDKDGYYKVDLSDCNEKRKHFVHRLVAESFIPNPQALPCVNHKDENKANNLVDNLEWCTIKHNNCYNNLPLRKGLKRRKPIIAIGKGKILYFESISEAGNALQVNPNNITSCLKGRRKSAGGYIFEYQKG